MKKLVKLFSFYIINFLITLKKKKKFTEKSLLILKLDGIGDYLLFRKYLEILKKDETYKNYKLTFVGNILWKDLAEELDKDYVDNFIWLDLKKFGKKPIYTLKKLTKLKDIEYSILINPTYSRTFFESEWISKACLAKTKIGSLGNLSNMKIWQQKLSNRYYDTLFEPSPNVMFEYFRNKEFFEYVLGSEIKITPPSLTPLNILNESWIPNKPYAVLFLGGSSVSKKWNSNNFAEIGYFLNKEYHLEIVICGGPGDTNDTINFKSHYKNEFYNLVGKTSLLELPDILSRAAILISNETSAPHFSVALGTKTIVLYCGNHFGRFVPYPKELTSIFYLVCHPKILESPDNYLKISNGYGYDSTLDINDISVESVKDTIRSVL